MSAAIHPVSWPYPVQIATSFSHFRKGRFDPAYRSAPNGLWRVTRLPSGPVTARITQVAADRAHIQAWGPGADELQSEFASWFPHDSFCDFDAPDAVIRDGQKRFAGLRTPSTGLVLEALIAAVLEQKVVGSDAFASWRQLLMKFGTPAPGPAPQGMRVVPTAEVWASIASWQWHAAGVDPNRYRTAQRAAHIADRIQARGRIADRSVTYQALRSIPGIGAWTAAEVGARALGDTDAASWGDYHLANTVGMGLRGKRVSDAEAVELLEPYRGFRGRVVRLLQLSPHVAVDRRGPRMSRINYRNF